jgi:hypothetical protein
MQFLPGAISEYEPGQLSGHACGTATVHVSCGLQVASTLHDTLALWPYSHSSPAMGHMSPSDGAVDGQGVAPASGPPELLLEDPDDEPLLPVLLPPLLLPDVLPEEPFPELLALPPEDEDPLAELPDDVLLPEVLPLEPVLLVPPPLVLPEEELPVDDDAPLPVDEPPDEPPDDVPLPVPLLEPLPLEVLPEPDPDPEPDPLAPPSAPPPSPRLSVKDDPPHDHIAANAAKASILARIAGRASNSDTR